MAYGIPANNQKTREKRRPVGRFFIVVGALVLIAVIVWDTWGLFF
jgi:hypothetical protein